MAPEANPRGPVRSRAQIFRRWGASSIRYHGDAPLSGANEEQRLDAICRGVYDFSPSGPPAAIRPRSPAFSSALSPTEVRPALRDRREMGDGASRGWAGPRACAPVMAPQIAGCAEAELGEESGETVRAECVVGRMSTATSRAALPAARVTAVTDSPTRPPMQSSMIISSERTAVDFPSTSLPQYAWMSLRSEPQRETAAITGATSSPSQSLRHRPRRRANLRAR